MSFVLLLVAFSLFYLYDINSITKQVALFSHCFFGGCFLLMLATGLLITHHLAYLRSGWLLYTASVVALCAFALLVYTLFFALPFGDTYQADAPSGTRAVCQQGMYALCRHPGVLWLAAFLLALAAMFGHAAPFWFAILATALNVIYVLLQDAIVFPKTFSGYDQYKQSTPFLIPNNRSIKRCISNLRGR